MAMVLFILTFLLIYGAINYYCFKLIDRSITFTKLKRFFLIVFFYFMTLSPIIVGIFLRWGHSLLIKEYAWLTYTYLGFITLFFCISVILKILKGIFVKKLSDSRNLVISTSLALIFNIYGYFEANNISVEYLELYTSKVTKNFKIAFLSDLHHGHMVSDGFVKRVLTKLNEENVDLLLLGGDILETGWDNDASMWDKINPPLGKFAVSGNHEFYLGYERAKKIFNDMGVLLLDNKAIDIGEFILIGLPDEVYKTQYGGVIEEPQKFNLEASKNKFTILLKHRPRKVEGLSVDLQLSGHTHKGQILPFSIVTKIFYPFHEGLYDLDRGYKIYVSRGIGTWGPRIRIASRPEITIIKIKREDKK